jgi:hypothetical protein
MRHSSVLYVFNSEVIASLMLHTLLSKAAFLHPRKLPTLYSELHRRFRTPGCKNGEVINQIGI